VIDWAEQVLTFWFGLEPEQWWKGDAGLDERIRDRFLELWRDKRRLPSDQFLGSPEEALAAVILFDQFPRNMMRGHADQYSTDHLALEIARAAVDRGFDAELPEARRGFLYMPFQHSEDLGDQQRSMLLFTALGNEEQQRYAKLHHDIIARFGRFPHRNAVLGRQPRPEEIAAGDVVPW
jgi:uncharacterized protein (DUF924 family)